MKTFLIVLVILVLLGIAIYLLIRKPEKVDNVVTKQDDDEKSKPDVKNDVLKSSGSSIQTDEIKHDEEVHIPEHCKIEKYDELAPNKYFFNIHKYTSKKGKEMFCVVCSAVINNENYRIIVKNSYYPYIKSYTTTIADRIRLMFENNKMTVDEFIKLGSTNFVGVGEIVESL